MTCEFCGKDHPNGPPKELTDAGHPYLTGGAPGGGFHYRVKGREEPLTSAEVHKLKLFPVELV